MKCYSCSFEGTKSEFGSLSVHSSSMYGGTIVGRMPKSHIGSVDVFVCPVCGALHSDMRGTIKMEDRKI